MTIESKKLIIAFVWIFVLVISVAYSGLGNRMLLELGDVCGFVFPLYRCSDIQRHRRTTDQEIN